MRRPLRRSSRRLTRRRPRRRQPPRRRPRRIARRRRLARAAIAWVVVGARAGATQTWTPRTAARGPATLGAAGPAWCSAQVCGGAGHERGAELVGVLARDGRTAVCRACAFLWVARGRTVARGPASGARRSAKSGRRCTSGCVCFDLQGARRLDRAFEGSPKGRQSAPRLDWHGPADGRGRGHVPPHAPVLPRRLFGVARKCARAPSPASVASVALSPRSLHLSAVTSMWP
mmetsp:Transcript_89807/g.274903  ORF Transcript_89807/g.274903 Transcript_89807/m.274903 type:complete len:231 (-) Transcript_89807:28-720(-)